MAQIVKFAIRGLYDERNIEIPFSDSIKIVVAENGSGKTTLLNALYGIMSGDIRKLRNIPFSDIEICFDDGSEFKVKKDDLKYSEELSNHGIYEYIKTKLGANAAINLLDSFNAESSVSVIKNSEIYKNSIKKLDIHEKHIFPLLKELSESNPLITKNTLEAIQLKTNYNFLYLPTYRRVEEDIRRLGLDNEEKEHLHDDAINFGMSDVDKKIKEISKEILTSSVEWFSKVNGEMLRQLVDGLILDDNLKNSIKDPEVIKIVLGRIGNNLDDNYKNKIIDLIKGGEIFENHDPLVYFIANLLKVYEQQKDNDERIQQFADICNKYLGDKKIEYNESNVTVKILRRKSGREVNIETLSSGEKQIISLFAKLYLQKENNRHYSKISHLSLVNKSCEKSTGMRYNL